MTRTINLLLILIVATGLAFSLGGCKSQKKLAREKAAAEYAAMVDKAKSDLKSFIDGTSTMSLDQKENRLEEIKNQQIDDPEIAGLIIEAEKVLADERSALIQKELEEKRKAEEAMKLKESASVMLEDYFSSITNASSTSEANLFINEALNLFTSPDSPVLIIISKTADAVDYDRPTTIMNYLNYLKDTGNNINMINNIKYDESGNITELELIKK
jgi:hypothetical protein